MFFTVTNSSCSPEPEIYLIPPNFKGWVVILFNQKDGTIPDYKEGSRIYRIPSSGILKTKFGSNTGEFGLNDVKFYFDGDSTRDMIPHFNLTKDSTLTQSQIFRYANGFLADGKIEYCEFIVAPYNLKDSFYIRNKDGVLIEDTTFWKRVRDNIEY